MVTKTAPGMVVCVDPRLDQDEYRTLLPKGAYRFSFVGACLGVAQWWKVLFEELEAMEEAGVVIDPLYLIDHTTCKAYGGDESREDHYRKMHGASQVVVHRYPQKTIHLRLLDMEGRQLVEYPQP